MHAQQLVLPLDHVADSDASQRLLTRFLPEANARHPPHGRLRPVVAYTAEAHARNREHATEAAAGRCHHLKEWHTGYLSHIPKDTKMASKIFAISGFRVHKT
jgi:hypothetical protein